MGPIIIAADQLIYSLRLRVAIKKRYSLFELCRRRPTAERRVDARRDDHGDTGRISRFCTGRNIGSPLRHCGRCIPACPRAPGHGIPCCRSIASCLSAVPDCGPPMGLSSDDRTPCMRRSIKPERKTIDLPQSDVYRADDTRGSL